MAAPQAKTAKAGATAASSADDTSDDALYPIAVLIDELRNEDVQVNSCILMQS